MANVQVFCTLAELEDDLDLHGTVKESVLMAKILSANDFVQMDIGQFLPVTETRKLNGLGRTRLFIPLLLSASPTIINDGTTLASTDYILNPNGRHWDDGPFSWLEVDPDAANLGEWVDEEEGVEITGKFGLYDRSEDTGADVDDTTQQSDSQTTLKVTDGSKVSPGTDLLIGTEQEYIESTGSPTTSVTTLAADLAANATQATVADGTKVKVGEIIRCGLEQMKVLDISGNLLDLARAWNRTKDVAHSSAAAIDVYRTFNVKRSVNGTTAAAHLNGVSIYRQMAPHVINQLARLIAGKMLKYAQSGYAGKLGDEQTGTVTYNYLIPQADLEKIRALYRIPKAG